MERIDTDIFISGAGIAGLSAAAIFGAQGYSIVLVDPNTAPQNQSDPSADLRSTAFLQPAITAFKECGLWDRLSPFATPLSVMRLVDAGGQEFAPRHIADFTSQDISDGPFGWNLPNWLLRREMMAHIAQLPNVSFMSGVSSRGFLGRSDQALVTLSNNTQIRSKLAIAADGRGSKLRELAGISTKRTDFHQTALVFVVSHSKPHENTSIEVHRTGGPFTLVPLPDQNGVPHSSVVWMDHAENIKALKDLDQAAFNQAANLRSCGVLGDVEVQTPRIAWPIISQLADQMTGPRLALLAEAAHVVPPIGAQGLNMSLADITLLAGLIKDATDIGTPEILDEFAAKRMADLRLRMGGITALNRAAMTDIQLFKDLRLQGLKMLHGIKPLREAVMKMGLGL